MKYAIREGRRARLHSFNNYRRFFDLTPYKSFEDLTDDKEVTHALQELYKDVDAVEYIVGGQLIENFK